MYKRQALRYEGTDLRVLTALAVAGHGLTLLPRTAATGVPGGVAVPVTDPRLVHRAELVHAGALQGAARELAVALTSEEGSGFRS